MKKRNFTSLVLNKSKISQLQNMVSGGFKNENDEPTMSTCSCVSCIPNCNTQNASTLGCTE